MVAKTLQEKEEQTIGKKDKNSRTEKVKKQKKQRIRVFPIWLRIIVVLILFALCLILGVIVGYGVIGDGNPTDALDLQTWQHILDIVQKE